MYNNLLKRILFPLFPYTFFPIFACPQIQISVCLGKNGIGPPPPINKHEIKSMAATRRAHIIFKCMRGLSKASDHFWHLEQKFFKAG